MSQASTLFVGNLEQSYLTDELESILVELFTQCGSVSSVRIPTDNGKIKGFAFVEMSCIEAATYATLSLNGLRLNGRFIRVACAMDDEKLRVEGLPSDFDELDLYEALAHNVCGIRGIAVRRTNHGKSEGKAIVWFESQLATEAAKLALTKSSVYLETSSLRILA